MKTKLLIALSLLGIYFQASGQNILDKYIQEGLENNLTLQEKNISLQQSLLALQTAKSYYLPAVDFGVLYNLASGGRTINVPIGDLLNGVYATLNQLTESNQFPQLNNISEQFLPNNFYDARIRVSMPLINPDLKFQKQIRTQQILVNEYDLAIYKASLIQDIKTAYFQFCTAHKAIEVFESSKELVERNLKDNQSLLKNGKGLPASVLRAEAEVENINALLIEAYNKKKNASYYLNFLLNKNLDANVEFEEPRIDLDDLHETLQDEPSQQRPEKKQVQTFKSIKETQLVQSKNYWIPRLSTFADFGSQAFDFEFNNQSRYAFFGLNLAFPLFQGGRSRHQIRQSQFEIEKIQFQENLLDQKLAMDLKMAKNEVLSKQAALRSSEIKLNSSLAYLRLVDRGFKEGSNSLIEFIDARNQYTQASLQQTINTYGLLISQANLERQLSFETY